MKIFDPHIHMTSRTTDDYERMAAAGIKAVCEPAFWLGQPRQHAGTFVDYFDLISSWEPERAANDLRIWRDLCHVVFTLKEFIYLQ